MSKDWIENLVEWLKTIEEKNYIWSLEGYDTNKLGASGLFCKLATIYGNYFSFDKEKLVTTIGSYKTEKGYYKDIPGAKNIIAESRQAMSGLINLGYDVGEYDMTEFFRKPLFFMNDSSWNNPWDAGAQLSHYIFFSFYAKKYDDILEVIDSLNKYKKINGWYNAYTNPNIIINGIMKIFTGFDVINYKLDDDTLVNICDFVLNNTSSHGGCNVYDYIYVLTKCMDIDYKIDIAKLELEKQFNKILTYQHKDGGFSYNKESSQTSYYGANITPGRACGDIHGTTLFSMALSRIDKYLELGLNLEMALS